ncbi:MAG TPA: hypothetical protein VHQ69_10765 [Methylomirabilota bacterium]|jgi:hypothetical protein|nr:hypothetical protein [Methylomirabilota bacterium]
MIQRRFPGSGPLAAVTLAIATIALGGCGGRKELPPLSAIVDAPYIRPGSSWTYKVEDTAWNAPQTVTLTFMKDDVYKNAGVLAFATASETILYDRDLNFVAVAADGRIIREASPSLRSFDFPFYVGKEWRSVFTFQDNQKGLSWTPVEVFWRVKEYDEITVPAGKFRSFLLESEPSTNWGIRKEQVWYAPQAKQLIKRIRERTAAHYEGKGKDTWELVQYTLK